jgi:hypothetical protein
LTSETVAVYIVEPDKAGEGVNIAVVPSKLNEVLTCTLLLSVSRTNGIGVTVDASICSLNVAVIVVVTGIPEVPMFGVTLNTLGDIVSTCDSC